MPKAKVFTLLPYYLPGYKSGGPLRTVSNMVDRLSERIEFYIYCLDRDAGDNAPYANVERGVWLSVGKAKVYYSRPGVMNIMAMRRCLAEVDADYVYLNSFFSPFCFRYLFLRKLRLVPQAPVVLAPRGEFSEGALAIKSLKKHLFLSLFLNGVSIYDGLIWQASSAIEQFEIGHVIGKTRICRIAPDLPMRIDTERLAYRSKRAKVVGEASFVYCSRISPKKNIHHSFPLLANTRGRVTLDIYGPPTDRDYAEYCMSEARRVPGNIAIRFHGPVRHEGVLDTLARYQFFLLPTLGENFGHALLEGFLAGCPVLVSNQTPWRNLVAQSIGWDIPLEDLEGWRSAFEACVNMDALAYEHLSRSAHAFGWNRVSHPPLEENYALFAPIARAMKRSGA